MHPRRRSARRGRSDDHRPPRHSLGLDKAQARRHRLEPCHVFLVTVDRWTDKVDVAEYCTDPRRHQATKTKAAASELVAASTRGPVHAPTTSRPPRDATPARPASPSPRRCSPVDSPSRRRSSNSPPAPACCTWAATPASSPPSGSASSRTPTVGTTPAPCTTGSTTAATPPPCSSPSPAPSTRPTTAPQPDSPPRQPPHRQPPVARHAHPPRRLQRQHRRRPRRPRCDRHRQTMATATMADDDTSIE